MSNEEFAKREEKMDPDGPIRKEVEPLIEEIKQAEQALVFNFYKIGTNLQVICRDVTTTKSDFEEIVTDNFKFSVSTAYRMIKVVKNYDQEKALKYGFSKCLELLKLRDKHDTFVKTFPVEKHSVRQIREKVKTFQEIDREKPIKKADPVKKTDNYFISFEVDIKKLFETTNLMMILVDDLKYSIDGLTIRYNKDFQEYERSGKIKTDLIKLQNTFSLLKEKMDFNCEVN